MRCMVCGAALCEPLVSCASCATPHHQECWQYAGGCAVYACANTVRVREPAKGPPASIWDEIPGALRDFVTVAVRFVRYAVIALTLGFVGLVAILLTIMGVLVFLFTRPGNGWGGRRPVVIQHPPPLSAPVPGTRGPVAASPAARVDSTPIVVKPSARRLTPPARVNLRARVLASGYHVVLPPIENPGKHRYRLHAEGLGSQDVSHLVHERLVPLNIETTDPRPGRAVWLTVEER